MENNGHLVDIIIPTLDNPGYVCQCVNSILMHTQSRDAMRIIVINNGSKEIENHLTKHPLVKLIHADKNLGWEGGLNRGLRESTTPFVCFMNDDTYIPYASSLWLSKLLSVFKDTNVAAVGPSSNVVRGAQNIFLDQFAGYHTPYAPFLIGFCVFVRRKDLDAAGGVDESLPGGDDFDLSIRLKKLGKKLAIARDVFVFHHGFKTGERLRGTADKPGGWNSRDMTETTNIALIRKHGFKEFINCNFGACENPEERVLPSRETETKVVADMVQGSVVYELGCGPVKTVPHAIGFDRVHLGDQIPNLEGAISIADYQVDVTKEFPVPDGMADTIIARHILEHVIDVVGTLKIWIALLKPGGRLIISAPDERVAMSIPMNPEHRHVFVPESLDNIMRSLGMKQIIVRDNYNGVSFTSCFEKGA